MRKKGFSLVELSLVLVIIGVLTVLAMKGMAVAQAAKFRAEVSKVDRLRTGVNAYLLTYESIETVSASYNPINLNDMIANAYISPTDVNSLIYLGEKWVVAPCRVQSNGYLAFANAKEYTITSPAKLCALLPKTRLELLCNMEVMMDDKNALAGKGRVTEGTVVDNTIYAKGCANIASGTILEYKYLYLIN